MSVPVDPGADAKVVYDDLELVTVASLDADDGSTLATATDVTCLHSVETGDEQGVGDGGVGFTQRSFWLVAVDVGFAPKKRDRLTRADGTRWILGGVTTESFDTIYVCQNCTRERT